MGEHHFRRAVAEYFEHYHRERNHQGLDNRLIADTPAAGTINNPQVQALQRLCGIEPTVPLSSSIAARSSQQLHPRPRPGVRWLSAYVTSCSSMLRCRARMDTRSYGRCERTVCDIRLQH
jgi:hypothetical protein